MAAALVLPVQAQPGYNSPNQFGDRQAGHWGDPGQGYFGNPAAGDFDKSKMIEPPPGTRPLGKVSEGKRSQASPYLSLPAPVDAQPSTSAPEKKKTAKTRKPAGKTKTTEQN